MNTNHKGYLDLKVGYRCNNDCIHCVIRDNEANLIADGKALNCTTTECLEMISAAAHRNVGMITLTGGEPTIRPDFFDLLKACNSKGIHVGVQTNGRSFHSSGFCRRLIGCGSPNFVVALHGANAMIHDAISQSPGSFVQTVKGIQNLCSAGYKVTGKLVISKLNADNLVQTMNLMASMGIQNACFAFPHGHGNARVRYREIVPRYAEIRSEIDHLTQSAATTSFDLSLETFPLCILNDPQYVIEFNYLIPIERRCIPSNAEEFNWDIMRPLDKHKFEQCVECPCDRYCEGPWKEYPETYGNEEFHPLKTEKFIDLLTLGLTEEQPEKEKMP